jgi:hypothetical protein
LIFFLELAKPLQKTFFYQYKSVNWINSINWLNLHFWKNY